MKGRVPLRVNADLGKYKAGSVVSVKADENGNVRDHYWKRRLEDAKIDGCVELVKQEPKKKKGAKKEQEEDSSKQ